MDVTIITSSYLSANSIVRYIAASPSWRPISSLGYASIPLNSEPSKVFPDAYPISMPPSVVLPAIADVTE